MYIDCHAHVFFSPFKADVIDNDICREIPEPNIDFIIRMIHSAEKKGVNKIIGVISNPDDFPRYEEQLRFKNIGSVIGISRNHALKDQTHLLSLLRTEIDKSIPIGVGEIGLDYSYGFDTLSEQEKNIIKKKQQELYRRQIKLAREFEIPIVVHAGYKTDNDIVSIIKKEHAEEVGGQIHGYMSDRDLVGELLDLGFYFSFGYLHTRENDLKNIIEITPLERILTETDAPYHLMENPKQFILPEDIVLIVEEIANLKDVRVKYLASQVERNVKALFRF